MSSESRRSRPSARAWTALSASALAAVCLIVIPRAGWPQSPAGDPAAVRRVPWKDDRVLRVCADPDNLPASNREEQGFDNRIAALIAEELGDSVRYVWWPQRRGFIRNTLRAHECDVVPGVPAGFDPVLSSRPYYRSTYYLVFPTARPVHPTSLDDPALRQLRVGVNLIGEDYTHTPPVHALLARGLSANVTGFSTFYGEDHHPGEIIQALERDSIDVAIAWGPLAGYFAKRSRMPLTLVPLPDDSLSGMQFAFDIGLGVRRGDRELRARLDEILERRSRDIERILRDYGVPTVGAPVAASDQPRSPSGGKPW